MKPLSQVQAMTLDQKNQRISEICGVNPTLVEYWCLSPDGSAVCMSHQRKEVCEKWLHDLPADSEYKSYTVQPYYRYPNYCGSRDAMAEAENVINSMETISYEDTLTEIVERDATTLPSDMYPKAATCCVWHASSAQRADAFLCVMDEPD